MKLADPATSFEGNLPVGTRLTFQLKSNPKMFAILSDGIYADKISAVIRELSCNAHDSNVMGRSPRPFTVNVPTNLETNFWVEDTGLGIDPDKIVDIFWTYGASTKTDSNETIGALGLGSKSPFAYTKSSFLVINRYNGMEYKYFCFINEVGIPDGKLMYQSPTAEPNGVRVELAVRADDIYSFRQRIVRFFSFWSDANMPKFNGDTSVADEIARIKSQRKLSGKTWELRGANEDVGRSAYAVMGGVPYPINRRNIGTPSPALQMVCDSMINITFPMGSLDFQVSREELSYTDETIKALEEGAKGIVEDILATSKAKLVGFATPFELSKAYTSLVGELSRSFAHVGNLMATQVAELTDGRKFRGSQLLERNFRLRSNTHLPFSIHRVERQHRDYSKGTQRYGLENELLLELTTPDVLDAAGKLVKRGSANVVPWFKVSTAPAPWKNQNRKRTAANYLHEGYAVTTSRFNYNSDDRLTGAFIINDMGDRGAEGIRFYAENLAAPLTEAFSDGNLFFIDGSAASLDADAVEAQLKVFIANSLLEGTPIIKLSALPNFKLPEAPKADPKPRAVPQRGTVEQRMTKFIFTNPKLDAQGKPESPRYVVESAESFDLRFRSPSHVETGYVRHELAKPMLYVDTNWGTPATEFDKQSVRPEVIGALYSLGLLDDFVQATPAGFEVRIGMLSPNHVEELARRKVPLVTFKSLFDKLPTVLAEQVELIEALRSRLGGDPWDDDRLMLSRLLSKHFIQHGLKHLPKTNKIAILATVHDKVKSLLKGNQVRCALLYLIYSGWAGSTDALTEKLKGCFKVDDLLSTYPLLQSLSFVCEHEKSAVVHQNVAVYINAVDSLTAQAKEAARLNELAALHAEALFELS
jgi:hypothetical protein